MATENSDQLVVSKMPVETQNVTWRITHFDKIRSSKEAVNLQKFHFEMGSSIGLPTKWTCFLKSQKYKEKDWIGVYMTLDNASAGTASKVLATFSFTFDDGKYFTAQTDMTDMRALPGWGFPAVFPSRSTDDKPVLPLHPDGSFSLKVEMSLFNFDAAHFPEVKMDLDKLMSQFESKFYKTLHEELLQVFKNPCPQSSVPMMVRVTSSDNREFMVCSGILAARSPIFRSMFETTMQETVEVVVKVDDISGKSLEAVLHYLHAGSLPVNWKEPGVVEGFTYAADKYLLEDLKRFLDQSLGLVCTSENCGKLLSLARKLNMSKAENDLMEFCKAQLKKASFQDMMEFFKKVESDEW